MTSALPSGAAIRYREHMSESHSRELMAQFGRQSSAYFALQSDVRRFGVDGVGFVAYAPVKTLLGRVNMVFVNPVCADQALSWLLKAFFQRVPGRVVFTGIDDRVARELEILGYTVNEMGAEFSVAVSGFSVAGKRKKQLRHAANLGSRHDLRVVEQTAAEVNQVDARRISEHWRQHKAVKQHELRLLTRPPVFSDEWGVRKFYCYQGERLLGYVFFDPYFKHGRVVGYTANVLRQDMDHSPSGLLDYIVIEAMAQFRREGVERMSLGISPLYNVRPRAGDQPLIRRICQVLYARGNRFYAFKALSYHKSRYRGDEATWYMAVKDTSVLTVAWTILRGTGIVGQPPLVRGDREPLAGKALPVTETP
ncbi:MAG: DUF2156 domain-containing protein [Marinobacter sp.]|nr:DUF2156 domain-containing protein [Marinobacter sp.]